MIVEGYRAVGSLNDSFQSSNFFIGTLCCGCCLLISVNGKTYKSAINCNWPIKIRTHHVVRKHTHRFTNGRQAVRADRQLDERSDGQTGIFEQIRYTQVNSTFKLI